MFDQSISKVKENLTELKLWNPLTKKNSPRTFQVIF